MPNKNARGLWIMLAVVVLILVLFVVFVDWRTVARQLRAADARLLLAASAALLAGLAAYAGRWRFLLANQPRPLAAFHAANVGHAVNTLVPLRAGEPARILVLTRASDVPAAAITSSVVVERLYEQVMRLTALGGAIAFGVGLSSSPGAILGGVAFVLALLGGMLWLLRHQAEALEHWPRALARLPRVSEDGARRLLAGALAGLTGVATPARLALGLGWSLLTWGCFLAFHYLALLALPDHPAGGQALSLALGALALAPPSAPTQPGVYHASVVAPLLALGFPSASLTAYAVVLHALQMLWMVGLGLWGLSSQGASVRELWPGNKA